MLQRIYIFLLAVVLPLWVLGQSNPITITMPSPISNPSNLSIDSYTRATTKINLQPGFKYGSVSSGATNLLNLSLGNNPTYVSSAYLGSGINPQGVSTCGNVNSLNPNIDQSKIAKEAEGSFNVSGSGAALYNIPIRISPGTAGMQPEISVQYNNQAGNGLLGTHFNLIGLSSISRTTKVPLHDAIFDNVKLTSDDVYAINGNRLFALNGVYGQNGTTYYTEIEDFSTITSYGLSGNGPAYFVVKDKSGRIYEYGNSSDAKLQGIGDANVLSWFLTKVTDEYGNYMTYSYKNQNGETVLERIDYTGNVSAGVMPYNTIEFEYMAMADKNTLYIGSKEFRSTQLLKAITCKTEGALFKKYLFNYLWNKQSCLSKVTEVLEDGSELNPTEFCWDDPSYFNNTYATGPLSRNVVYNTSTNPAINANGLLAADFNGDGFTDNMFYYSQSDNYHYYLNTPNNTLNQAGDNYFVSLYQSATGAANPLRKHLYSAVIDSDLDSRHEVKNFIKTGSNTYRIDDIKLNSDPIYGSYTNNFAITTNSNFTLNNPIDENARPNPFYYDRLEFTSDGSQDEVRIDPDGIYINSEIGSVIYPITTLSTIARPFDFNGDGAVEIIIATQTSPNNVNLKIIAKANSGAPIQLTQIYATSISFNNNPVGRNMLRQINYGDFNGDGKTDICYIDDQMSGVWIMYSTGVQFLPAVKVESFTPAVTNINYINTYMIDVYTNDINQDGKCDISVFDNTTTFNNYYAYFSLGDKIIYGGSLSGAFSMTAKIGYKPEFRPMRGGQTSNLYIFADYNGDGKADIITMADPSQEKVYYGMVNGKSNLLATAIFRPASEFVLINYGNIKSRQTEVPAYFGMGYVGGTPIKFEDTYTEENLASFSGNLIKTPPYLYCVNRYVRANAGLNEYKKLCYRNAIIHTKGRGFLGFEKIMSMDVYTNLGEIRKQNFDATYVMPSSSEVSSGKVLYNGAQQPITMATTAAYQSTSISFVPRNLYSFFISTNSTTSKDYLKSSETNTSFTYDLTKDGNLTSITKTFGWAGTILRTESINNSYVLNNGTYKLQSILTSQVQTGESAYNREVTLNYDAQGHTISQVNDPTFGVNALTTNYSQFNAFGNSTKVCVSAGDVSLRCGETQYDSKGRFITKTTNAINNTQELVFDPKYGNVLQSKDISGLVTIYQYDAAGRLLKTIYPTGVTSQMKYEWNTNSSVPAQYKVTEQTQGAAERVQYLGYGLRTVKVEQEAINNRRIISDFKYNLTNTNLPLGILLEQSEPHYANQVAYLINRYTYEPLLYRTQRQELFTFNNGSYSSKGIFSNYNYNTLSTNTSYNKSFVEITDQLGRSSRKEYNKAGQLDVLKNTDVSLTQVSNYGYGSLGQVKQISLSNSANPGQNITTTFAFNSLGQQISLTDPSSGTINYQYNTIGELMKQIAPTGTFDFTYDLLGRVISKTGSTSGTTYYQYVTAANGREQIEKVINPNATSDFKYDNFSRLIEKRETVGAKIFKNQFSYNNLNQLTKRIYASGYEVNYDYNPLGFTEKLRNSTNNVIWQVNDYNAMGQITDFALGNGLSTNRIYNDFNYLTNESNGIYNSSYDFNQNSLNMVQRQFNDAASNVTKMEQFIYDELDRLTKSREFLVNGSNIVATNNINNIGYDALGNINRKDDAGSPYVYGQPSKPYQLTAIQNASSNLSFNTLNVTYTDFNKINQISEMGSNKEFLFTYNGAEERVKMEYKVGGVLNYTRYYSDEYDLEETATDKREWTYINAPTGLAAIYYKKNGTGQLLYVTSDHLGSPIALTNSAGQLVEAYSFDAWGRRRDPNNWSNFYVAASQYMIRGYTMHEHLDEVGLINMNGRVYDPVVGRFIQPDNYIQAPDVLQNYNRYSYVLNNPLKYTDPSGYWAIIDDVIAGAIGGVCNLAYNAWQGNINSLSDVGVAFGSGAAAGVLALYGPLGWAAGGALVGGANAYLGGANDPVDILKAAGMGAISGLAGGVVGSAVTPGVNSLVSSSMNQVVANTVVGGASGAITGGVTSFFMTYATTGNLSQSIEAAKSAALVGLIAGAGGGYISAKVRMVQQSRMLPESLDRIEVRMVQETNEPQLLDTDNSIPLDFDPNRVSNNQGTVRIVNGNLDGGDISLQTTRVHGNSLSSQRPTWGYKLYRNDGTFLKNGITSRTVPESRYTKAFMSDKYMVKYPFPNRASAYQWEYQQNQILRGPLNRNMH